MNRDVINPQELPVVNSTYSQAIKANGLVFVAGQIGIDPATGKLIAAYCVVPGRSTFSVASTVAA